MEKVDFVMIWVDGADPEWQREKAQYAPNTNEDSRVIRYRDWNNLQYWFRGIEKFTPWVNRIHFVTWGHLPSWLNTNHPKLNIVKHSDFIPQQYLPTFSSHTIELNLHRIPELSEQFVYFNDDTFVISPMDEEDFFKNDLPCDAAIESVLQFKDGGIDHIIARDLELINSNFKKRQTVKANFKKWFFPKYGKKLLHNLYLQPFSQFVGFENPHLPIPYLKSTFRGVWKAEPETLNNTCLHKFREALDVNQWLMRYWQFATGNFAPKLQNGKFFSIGKEDTAIKEALQSQNYQMICLSDDDPNLNFAEESSQICKYFDRIFPNKSSFER